MPPTPTPAAERPARRKLKLPERRFKQFAVATTVAGLIVMAIGINALIVEANFLLFLPLFAGGALLASASVFVEIRPPTPEEAARAAAKGRGRRRSGRRAADPEPDAAVNPPSDAGLVPDSAPRTAAEPVTVTLYTRKSCPACREAREILHGWRERYGIEVWEEDVDADPALQEEWSDWVPVGVVKGRELFRLSLVPAVVEPRLRDALEGR